MNWGGVSQEKKQLIDKRTDEIAKKLSVANKPSVGIKTRFIFGMMGTMHKKGWNSSPVETDYWTEKGWLSGKKPWNE
ncbi:MAG: hypothetical protein Q4D99_05125 [Bacillota bacterium]|nr:hypothetical protein [Bacillota bacterium]